MTKIEPHHRLNKIVSHFDTLDEVLFKHIKELISKAIAPRI